MRRALALLLLASGLAGCSTLNPFSSGDMAKLPDFEEKASLHSLWRYSIGKAGDAVFYPMVVGNTVFIAAANGTIARLENGVEQWRVKTGKPISAGVGSDGERVVVGTRQGEVLAFSASDGTPLWQAQTSSEILVPPLVEGDMVIVRGGDDRVEAYDGEGKRKWFYQRPMPNLSLRNTAPMLFAGQFILTGFPGGRLLALSEQNGAPVWEGTVALPKGATELERIADVVSPPAAIKSTACAVAFQGRVTCFDFSQNGSAMWSRDISSWAGLSVDSRSVFATDDESAIHALDITTGSSRWKMDRLLRRKLTAPQVVGSSYLAAGDVKGYVHIIERISGLLVGRKRIDRSPILVMPVRLSDNQILVQTRKGTIEALEVR
ncbi:MAG: outer membrane protein assembly factor BamB [Zoogloeaceae bacterium]|jgi:outer membrane protein assembly factor BamB|nr:outer membrane protein assembly factor BamB [Zoogloeaceae bacterium]